VGIQSVLVFNRVKNMGEPFYYFTGSAYEKVVLTQTKQHVLRNSLPKTLNLFAPDLPGYY
jgi:hypothetical protein